ncbi:hypothetical protein Pelo_19016 [Pelomyxa schiedti]|nr:hypothetical protein Pelo_19016 [Pelomyxa schiedti]
MYELQDSCFEALTSAVEIMTVDFVPYLEIVMNQVLEIMESPAGEVSTLETSAEVTKMFSAPFNSLCKFQLVSDAALGFREREALTNILKNQVPCISIDDSDSTRSDEDRYLRLF